MSTTHDQELPKTMRGWAHTKAGLPESVLELSSELHFPSKIGKREVLVEISHVALNPGASVMIQLLPMVFRTKPSIPEMDFAGTLVSVGAEVSPSRDLQPGMKVFGSIPVGQHVGKGKGSMAEYVVVPAEHVCKSPENMPLEQAAGLGIAGVSALALVDAGTFKEGDKVLVNAASGGVGSLAVQILKNAVGGHGKIVAICSGANAEMVKMLGADEVIDYQKVSPVHTYITNTYSGDQFDSIVDCLGSQELFLNCAGYLKHGMPYIAIGVAPSNTSFGSLLWTLRQMLFNSLWPSLLGGVNRPYTLVTGMANLKDMERLAVMVREKKLQVPIDSSWELSSALKAYERILSKHARGKVIVVVKNLQ